MDRRRITIASASNSQVRWVRKVVRDRKARRKEAVWVAEGVRLAAEVLGADAAVRLWVLEEDWGRTGARDHGLLETILERADPVLVVKRGVFCELADTRHPQGVLAVVAAPSASPEEVLGGAGPLVILDGLQDPGNLGTVARAAEAAGAGGLLLSPGTADPGGPKSLRASAGSLLRLPAAWAADPVAAARAAGFRVLATAGTGGLPYHRADLTGRLALLLGQEGAGLAPGRQAAADLTVTIPMAGQVESLNVAVAASVILFEAARQRDLAEGSGSSR